MGYVLDLQAIDSDEDERKALISTTSLVVCGSSISILVC